MHRNFLQGLYSVYDIGGLYAKHNREYNVFLHEPFLVLSLKRVVLEENRSIKTDLVTFLFFFICYVSYLTWPDPPAHSGHHILAGLISRSFQIDSRKTVIF